MDPSIPQQSGGAGAAGVVLLIIDLAVIVLVVASLWKIFTKAGKPGWAAIVPIYNAVVMLQICGKPIWWIVLLFIPLVNLLISILVCVALAEAFGKGVGFAIGLLLLGIVFFPILAFGSAQYVGPGGGAATAPATA